MVATDNFRFEQLDHTMDLFCCPVVEELLEEVQLVLEVLRRDVVDVREFFVDAL